MTFPHSNPGVNHYFGSRRMKKGNAMSKYRITAIITQIKIVQFGPLDATTGGWQCTDCLHRRATSASVRRT